ncbi:MAG TPA: Spy/CpxP family protein refolding chaperone [Stellaceae bacterium]|nr:Spy/CpxP family protein refolding chaperone [Stellaceae bacterium]
MRSMRLLTTAAALMIATTIAGGVGAQDQAAPQAQSGGPMMGGWMMGPHGMMGSGMGPGMMGMGPGMMAWSGSGRAMCTMMTGHTDGRLAYLKAELKITDAQEPLWASYAAAVRDNAKTMLAHCNAMMTQRGSATLSLPDRLDKHEQLMAAHLESLRAMNKALKPLYAALDDAQKQTIDQLFLGPMGMM